MLTLLLMLSSAFAAPTLTLDQALQAADDRAPGVAALEAQLAQADAQLAGAWAAVLPYASAGLSYSHADHEDTMDLMAGLGEGLPIESEPTVIAPQDSATTSLTVAWSVLSPSSWAAVRTGSRGSAYAEATVRDARQELLMGTAQAWYAARMSGELVEMYEAQVDSAQQHLDASEARLEAGAGLRLDVVRAQSDLAEARQQLVAAERAWETSRDMLGMLTGLSELPLTAGAASLSMPGSFDIDAALARRTDLAATRAQVDLAESQLTLSRSQLLPTVDLAWQGRYQLTEMSDMGSDDPTRWTLSASLTLPLVAPGQWSGAKESRAALRVAEARLDDAERQAELELRQYRRDWESAVESADIADLRSDLSEEALDLSLAAYDAGAGSSLDVTDSRRSAISAQADAATQRLQADLALLGLLRANGTDMLSVAAVTGS